MVHRWVRDLSCEPNIYLSWFTSEIRVRLVPSNMFQPSSKILTIPWRCFLWTLMLFVTVTCSIDVTCWEKTDLLGFVYAMLSCIFVMFPYGVLGQCWYLIVSIPNHCLIPKGLVTIRCIAPTYADVWKIQQVRCYLLSTLEISFKHVTNTL